MRYAATIRWPKYTTHSFILNYVSACTGWDTCPAFLACLQAYSKGFIGSYTGLLKSEGIDNNEIFSPHIVVLCLFLLFRDLDSELGPSGTQT